MEHKILDGITTGSVYRTERSTVVVLELYEEEYGNEFMEKGEKWANVMHLSLIHI